MKKTVLLALTSALALGSLAMGGGGGAPPATQPAQQTTNCRSIADLVATDANFSTLRTALEAAGLTGALRGNGPLTVFAPTNAAFAKLPAAGLRNLLNDRATLTRVLQYHVATGRQSAQVLRNVDSVSTIGTDIATVTLMNNRVMINDATVTRADVAACNGVVHVIDTVLLPPGVSLPTAAAPASNATAAAPAAPAATTVADLPTLLNDARFSTLKTALDTAGLTEVLAEGQYTIFAPTNDAFAKVPKEQLDALLADTAALAQVLNYHVVEGEANVRGTSLTSLQGGTLALQGGRTVAGATISGGPVRAGRSTVYVIDTVLMPEGLQVGAVAEAPAAPAALENSVSDVIGRDPRFSTLAAALKAANLVTAFDTPGEYTVFAPTNEAFAKIPKERLDALLANPEALFQVLSYHVVPSRVGAADVRSLTTAQTLQGADVAINAGGTSVMVGTATVIATDIAADNGVIHAIDTVLLPPNFTLP